MRSKTVSRKTYIVEDARFERDGIQLLAQGTKCTTIHRVSVRRTHDVWTCGVNGTVNDERCFIQDLYSAVVENIAFVIDAKQVALVDAVEVDSKRVDPKCVWLDGISDCDVSSYTLIKPEMAKYSLLWC